MLDITKHNIEKVQHKRRQELYGFMSFISEDNNFARFISHSVEIRESSFIVVPVHELIYLKLIMI